MSINVGRVDRVFRFLVGVGVLGLYGALDAPLKYLTLLGFVLIATAVTGVCPLYSLLRINTCGHRPEGRAK